MRIEEVKGRISFEVWLKETDQPQEICVALAHRVVLRVLPLYLERVSPRRPKSGLTPDRVLWASLISGVAAVGPTPEIKTAAADAAYAATAAASAAASAADAAASAAYAADAAYAATAAASAAASAADAAASAYAATTAYAATAAWDQLRNDLRQVADGASPGALLSRPIWDQETPDLAFGWPEIRQAWEADGPHWRFWIDWYEGARRGTRLETALLTKIALLDQKNDFALWTARDPAPLRAAIGEIYGAYLAEKKAVLDYFEATLFDFEFDKLAEVMRAVPMPDDWKHLDDPEALRRMLADAADLRESLEDVAGALRAEGAGMQGAGSTAFYCQRVLDELARAETEGRLQVAKLNEWGRILEATCALDGTKAEFGAMFEPLKICTEKLRDLVRAHFAASLARFTVLRDLDLEETLSPWEAIHGFRALVVTARTETSDRWALADEDAAVLDDVLDSVDRLIRQLEAPGSDNAKGSLRREVNFQLAKVGASLGHLGQTAQKTEKVADRVLATQKRVKGIGGLLERAAEALTNGGG